jgi:ricin-type beta-trefoil lectin protein
VEHGRKLRRLGLGAALVLAAVAAMMAAPVSSASAAPPVPTGTYAIVNVNSGKCLMLNGSNPGDAIFQTRCKVNGETNLIRQWFTFQNLDGNDAYRISGFAGGGCMAIGSSATHDGAWAIQWFCAQIADQTWRLVPSGSGFAIVNAHSGKCLAIGSGATHDGAIAIQWTCLGSPEQQWVLRRV